MADKRERLIKAFALRFLASNLDDEVQEALDDSLNSAEQPSLISTEELEEIAEGEVVE